MSLVREGSSGAALSNEKLKMEEIKEEVNTTEETTKPVAIEETVKPVAEENTEGEDHITL